MAPTLKSVVIFLLLAAVALAILKALLLAAFFKGLAVFLALLGVVFLGLLARKRK